MVVKERIVRDMHRCTADEVTDGFDYHDIEPYSDLNDLIERVFDSNFGSDLNGASWREGAGHEIFQAGVYRKDQRMTTARADTAEEALACALVRALDKEEGITPGLATDWPW